jgi:hypothetical protein
LAVEMDAIGRFDFTPKSRFSFRWAHLITECRGLGVRGASEGLGLPLFDSRGDDAFFLEWDARQ